MSQNITVLGIESSCDETSVAVVQNGELKSNIISSQYVHQKYGGVVPELASRAHQKLILPVVQEAMTVARITQDDISGVAAVMGPGLLGSILIGLNFAKAYAYALGVPFIAVNHMEAHIYSNFIEAPTPEFPFLCLTVSGGHTQLVLMKDDFQYELLGETRDDAAGEAFDKAAKMLGLGYPGGPAIDKLAKQGNPNAIRFPKSLLPDDPFGFSFSGIKTALLYYLRDGGYLNTEGKPNIMQPQHLSDICASFQASVVDTLVIKTMNAARQLGVKDIAVAGGVSANSFLRERMSGETEKNGFHLFVPRFEYCTDNGAMIGIVGYRKMLSRSFSPLSTTAVAGLELPV